MQTHLLAKPIRPVTFIAVVIGILGLVAYSQETQGPTEKKPALSLQIATILAKAGPTVVYIATNNTDKELVLERPGISGSPVVIIKPDGKVVRDAVAISRSGPPPAIKPQQTLTWSEDLYDIFNLYSLNEAGLYRVSWQAATSEPNTPHNAVYKSNELLVVREKGTPAIDRTTGRPFDPDTGQLIDPATGKPFPGQDK